MLFLPHPAPSNSSSWPHVGLAAGFASVRGKENLQQPGGSSREPYRGMDSTSSAEAALLCAESTETLLGEELGSLPHSRVGESQTTCPGQFPTQALIILSSQWEQWQWKRRILIILLQTLKAE